MIRAMRTAASGMMAQQTQVDTIANNIANVNTASFKKNRVNFRSLLYTTLREPGATTVAAQQVPTGLQIGTGTEVSSSIKLFLQGDIEQTGNPLDLAIQGDGFFNIAMGNGEFR
jgi:flagellar basal-body rod protein FlgG